MGFPRDYLDFTTWYLLKKGYITRADNSDFTLTADGVDFVETQRVNLPILNKLLPPGSISPDQTAEAQAAVPKTGQREEKGLQPPVPSGSDSRALRSERRAGSEDRREGLVERRVNTKDRRQGKPDLRASPIERRVNIIDRRRSPGNRRVNGADRRANHPDAAPGASTDPPDNGANS